MDGIKKAKNGAACMNFRHGTIEWGSLLSQLKIWVVLESKLPIRGGIRVTMIDSVTKGRFHQLSLLLGAGW